MELVGHDGMRVHIHRELAGEFSNPIPYPKLAVLKISTAAGVPPTQIGLPHAAGNAVEHPARGGIMGEVVVRGHAGKYSYEHCLQQQITASWHVGWVEKERLGVKKWSHSNRASRGQIREEVSSPSVDRRIRALGNFFRFSVLAGASRSSMM